MNKFLEEKMRSEEFGCWDGGTVPSYPYEKGFKDAVSLLWPVVERAKVACADTHLLHEDFNDSLSALTKALKSIGELDSVEATIDVVGPILPVNKGGKIIRCANCDRTNSRWVLTCEELAKSNRSYEELVSNLKGVLKSIGELDNGDE